MVLRLPRPDDAAAYVRAWADDPGMPEAMGRPAPPEKEVRRRFRDERRDRERGEVAGYVVSDEDDAFKGFFLLHSFAWEHRRAEVGVMLAPAARGRGIATAALRLVVRWGLDKLQLQRIGLMTLPGNPAGALAERAGFTYEGTLHRYTREFGKPMDNVVYGVWA